MSRSYKRKMWAAALLCGAGTLFQLGPSGCANYAITAGLTAFDFCSVLNCEAGSYFNVCSPQALFMDCSSLTTTTTP